MQHVRFSSANHLFVIEIIESQTPGSQPEMCQLHRDSFVCRLCLASVLPHTTRLRPDCISVRPEYLRMKACACRLQLTSSPRARHLTIKSTTRSSFSYGSSFKRKVNHEVDPVGTSLGIRCDRPKIASDTE